LSIYRDLLIVVSISSLYANNSIWTRNFLGKTPWYKKIIGMFPEFYDYPSPVNQNIGGVNLENFLGIFPRICRKIF
jgi:hypothetical protein